MRMLSLVVNQPTRAPSGTGLVGRTQSSGAAGSTWAAMGQVRLRWALCRTAPKRKAGASCDVPAFSFLGGPVRGAGDGGHFRFVRPRRSRPFTGETMAHPI